MMTQTGSPVVLLARSGEALLAGLVVVAVATTAADQIFHASGVFPPWGEPMFATGSNLLALAYRIAFGILGGWVAARLAPRSPVAHAVALGLVGTALSVAGAVEMVGFNPLWFFVAVILSALPSTWIGGRLAARP